MTLHLPFKPTEAGFFVERLNRFVALVELNGETVAAHIATSGRLTELLVPGASVLLERNNSATRRTAFSVRAVWYQQTWVSIDAQLPNKLVKQVLLAKALPPFEQCEFVRSEPVYSSGRFDFLLAEAGQAVYVEVKSVTLVIDKVALFPDAPTARGRRHLAHLADLQREGCRCAVIFIIQRGDADYFAPNRRTDLQFGQSLRQAASAGVELYAYRCRVDQAGMTLAERLPVLI
ncbi:MAG TPA: DNA/RNA nuclease SfsA [Oscillospiraceae bacterium]|nr:DNA/RNA nuclease SfsA [Oscillospiraceae bacterium]